jgi:integrase
VRVKAREWLRIIAEGNDPANVIPAKRPKTVAAVLDDFVARYVRAKGQTLRSADLIESAFDRLVKPRIGNIGIYTLRRSNIVAMLDEIAAKNGPMAADRVLAHLSKAFNWFATGDDEFTSPIVRGMARVKAAERARQRVLSDDELRAVWVTAEGQGTFGALLRFVLLTATRRNEAARARWSEISGTEWLIPGARYKTKTDHLVPLSQAAREVLARQPQFAKCDLLFTLNGKVPICGIAKFKRRFEVACGVTGWTLHDLRRTARSLMSRAGVAPDHAERCLGHVIGGVRGTYDRHAYAEEKARAFEALAAQIERIVNPKENVVAMRGRE